MHPVCEVCGPGRCHRCGVPVLAAHVASNGEGHTGTFCARCCPICDALTYETPTKTKKRRAGKPSAPLLTGVRALPRQRTTS
jgi:hypothetical protein